MKKHLILFILVFISTLGYGSVLKFEKGLEWVSLRDLTSAEFSTNFKKYTKAGYLMIDVDAYRSGSSLRYAMVWRKNKDGRAWAEHRDMTSEQYHAKWQEYKTKGYRPLDIESYRVNGTQKYAGIWVENKERYGWSSKRNLTASAYGNYFQEQRNKGYRVVDIEAYQTSGGTRYAAIWVQNKENIAWAQFRDMSRSAYQDKVNEYSKKGYILVDFEAYKVGNADKYAGIWEKHTGFSSQARTNRTKLEFANLWREYRDKGYRLVDFERYSTSGGVKYGGIWIENSTRFRYSKKGELDNLMASYKKDNNLPGISVAIIKDGKMIYRKGVGYADKGAKKVAHGETIYQAASISKVIGGTMAVKFQTEGKLRNKQAVSLDVSKNASSYLNNIRQSNGTRVSLPAQHTQTVAQMTSHIACIQHYSGPEPTTQHYTKAIDALSQIWNAPLINNCTIGSSRNYSTHAFTYLAAILESVTNKSIPALIRSEIAVPYKLNSLRATYTNASIPSNYERAKGYNNSNNATSLANNSWKFFGGGIEVSPVDLAWFGWKVLDGKIVSASARDNILWKRVNANRTNGIAWEIRNIDNKRVAEHGGSFDGTYTRLRVYRDDGLVIAIMSNRRNHAGTELRGLATSIANVIL